MLGLANAIYKGKGTSEDLGIITDNLVLNHSNYGANAVQPCSTGAVYLDQSNTDKVSFGDVCDLGSTADFTICFWVYLTTTANQSIIVKRESAANYWEVKTQGDGKPQFITGEYGSGSTVLSHTHGTAITANTWAHVAVSFDRSDTSNGKILYLNGVASATGACNDTDIDNSGNLEIGLFNTTYMHDGYVCNFGIWNVEKDQAQIKSIMHKDYASLSDSEKTGLVSWWNLDEETDTDGTAGTGGVKDYHGSNHGTLS